MKIIVAGAGRGGLNLAVHLQKRGHAVVVIERDPAIAQLASDHYGIVTLNGDATEAATLRQSEPSRSDVMLAMLHRDADNLGVSLLARTLGAKRIIARMRDPAYRQVYEDAGIRQLVSETEVLVGALATAVEFESVQHSMVLGSGDAIAFELKLEEKSWVLGRSVSDVATSKSFPRSCVVAGMAVGGRIQAPRGASVFEAGMDLLLVSAREDLSAAIDFFVSHEPR